MEFFDSSGFDIFDVYMRYCEIKSGNACLHGMEGHMLSDEIEKVKFSREALVQLSKVVDSRINERVSIFEALYWLMSRLNLSGDFSEFSNFYEFVFFICRENGQKNITVSKAIAAWKLVLAGRFRLLNQWCDFVEKNQRHNISEDTWGQVLAFSRCVHENLEGYDPEGAWPTLIDDFVEHMYRVTGSRGCIDCNFTCHCGDPDAQAFASEDALPGLKNFPGLKRKLHDECHRTSPDISSSLSLDVLNLKIDSKRRKQLSQLAKCENEPPEGIRHQSSLNPPKSPCGVEGCLSKGFATLLSSHSCAHIDQDTGYLVHECSM